jgi:hypothetical protein
MLDYDFSTEGTRTEKCNPYSFRLCLSTLLLRGILPSNLFTFIFCFIYPYKTCPTQPIFNHIIYRMSQEEKSVFWELILSFILSKKLYMSICPIPNCFMLSPAQMNAKTHSDEQHAMSSHELQVHSC